MTEGAGTAAAAGGEGGSESQTVNSIPADWAENEHFKDFYGEDKTFDFGKLSESYASTKAEVNTLKENQPVVPDDYSFEFPKEGYPIDEAEIKLQREMAKEAGLTQGQYEAAVKFDIARYAQKAEQITNAAEEAKSELVKKWGGAQKFEANMAAAAKIGGMVFGKEFVEKSELGNDTALLEGLYLLSQKLSEDTFREGSSAGSDGRKAGVDGEKLFNYGNG
jgi:hypothetical protein